MSFSGNIKEELSAHYAKARHCRLAELSAVVHMCGGFLKSADGTCILGVHTENIAVARKCFTLIEKTFNIRTDIAVRRNTGRDSSSYFIRAVGNELLAVKHASVQAVCCKRSYIRGAFLAAGSMSDPSKSYHFEIVCSEEEEAIHLRDVINSFDMDAKIVPRKKTFVVYLKEGSQIVDILNVMEAHIGLMELENVRILKEMRNSVNRKVNCEISYIKETVGFDKLPEGLKDVALTRLEYPEATLKELGSLLREPLGKSGVNHRLRKLSEIADKLREQ